MPRHRIWASPVEIWGDARESQDRFGWMADENRNFLGGNLLHIHEACLGVIESTGVLQVTQPLAYLIQRHLKNCDRDCNSHDEGLADYGMSPSRDCVSP